MFGLISTKDLYIVELSTYRGIDFSNFPFCKYIFDKYKRYALCKKKDHIIVIFLLRLTIIHSILQAKAKIV